MTYTRNKGTKSADVIIPTQKCHGKFAGISFCSDRVYHVVFAINLKLLTKANESEISVYSKLFKDRINQPRVN